MAPAHDPPMRSFPRSSISTLLAGRGDSAQRPCPKAVTTTDEAPVFPIVEGAFSVVHSRSRRFRHLRISPDSRLVRSCPDSQSNKQRKNEVKNIFVGNLNFGATEDSVRSLFEVYGPVERVNLVTDRDTGRAKGFGFVEMSANADADRAIAGLNGTDLDGRA